MLGRPLAVALLLAALTFAGADPASAQDAEPEPITGELVLTQDLRVAPGETLALGPGAYVHGNGRILVYGSLSARGTAEDPVVLAVPVYVFTSDSTVFEHARFDVARGHALQQSGGIVRVLHASFVGAPASTGAILLTPTAAVSLTIEDSRFSGFGGTALDLHGPGVVDVKRATFTENTVGVLATLDGAGAFLVRVSDSAFTANDNHVRVHARPAGASPSSFEISRSLLTDATASPQAPGEGRSALIVLEDAGAAGIGSRFAVTSTGNRYASNPQGVYLRSGAPVSSVTFTSIGDTFASNRVGLEAQGMGALVRQGVFTGNTEWDVHVPYAIDSQAPLVVLEESTYTQSKIRVAPGAGAVDAGGKILRSVGLASASVGLVALGAVLWSDASRAFLARVVFAPLYTRLRPGDVLANPARRMILDYVTANPGAHMRRIGHMLNISYGTLAYHLYRLEKDKYVASREEGLFKRYYPSTGGVKAASENTLMPTALRSVEREILNVIIATPGKPQSAIAADLGVSRQSLHYHIKKLESQGFITKVPRGRETLIFAKEEAVAAAKAADAAAAAPLPATGAQPAAAEAPATQDSSGAGTSV